MLHFPLKYSTFPVQQKFDFHASMCYNFKAKLANQCFMKLDVPAQGPDKTMGGLSKYKKKNGEKCKESDAEI